MGFHPPDGPEGYASQWGAAITDGYILGNPTDTDVTLTLLYPIVGGIRDLLSIDPSVTVNGEKAEKELVIGDYAGGFGGAGGGDTSTLNLRYPSQWTDYQTLLDGGGYRKAATGTHTTGGYAGHGSIPLRILKRPRNSIRRLPRR